MQNKKKLTGNVIQEPLRKVNDAIEAEADKLRVSSVDLQKDMEANFVELQMDNLSNNS